MGVVRMKCCSQSQWMFVYLWRAEDEENAMVEVLCVCFLLVRIKVCGVLEVVYKVSQVEMLGVEAGIVCNVWGSHGRGREANFVNCCDGC